jgi:hypothetical protein
MSIICKICDHKFEKIIPWQHLKLHKITTKEYKQQHGNIYSDETLEKHSKKIPHNKGKKVTDPNQLANIRNAVKIREELFQRGEIVRGRSRTPEEKQHLSETTKRHAEQYPEEVKIRAQKATQTKIDRGYDFGKPMRGKTHSEESKEKIKFFLKQNINKKAEQSHTAISENIKLANLTLNNSLLETRLDLTCNICTNKFQYTKQCFQPAKFKKQICPYCYPRTITSSKGEKELFEFIAGLFPDAIQNYRQSYHDKEIDIFLPSENIGFEFTGLYWHSETVLLDNGRSPKTDYEKYLYFSKKNIRVYSIFEDEWKNKQSIVKSRIKNILGKTENKIYARKCTVKEIDSTTASEFCEQNHIMGKGRSNIRLGLYHQNELVSVMTFVNNNLSRKSKLWEINRFASIENTNVVGGASRLFKWFLRIQNPRQVISYADTRWSNGDLYSGLGFDKVSNGTPNYWYFLSNGGDRIHRFALRKTKEDNQTLTEYQNRLHQGYLRIWDYGSSKWKYTVD